MDTLASIKQKLERLKSELGSAGDSFIARVTVEAILDYLISLAEQEHVSNKKKGRK